ncbi:acyl carrier protein [Amycolatopsis sp. NPDC021455]|uniref:acyl carrier protein n=1 Tax=Amycolatopsis sp. NPDC021455 TaxID=3154901 RepID=UPI0033DDDCF5
MTDNPQPVLDRETIQDALSRAIAVELESEGPPDPDAAFADLGLDSVAGLRAANTAGAEIGLKIPVVLLFDYPSISELAKHLSVLSRAA